MTLPHVDAPRAARRAVAACCARISAGPVCVESAALMTSEVVTNAILHGSGPLLFGVESNAQLVRVEVGDDDRQHPVVAGVDRLSTGGRGMMLVQELAADWGVLDTAAGKLVWFEVDVQP